jgi:hypothetical protein
MRLYLFRAELHRSGVMGKNGWKTKKRKTFRSSFGKTRLRKKQETTEEENQSS